MRQSAGLVMTHLILKDMVKVKGQVSEMAALLLDPEEEIMGLAQSFFSELSSKASWCWETLVHSSREGLMEAWSRRRCISCAEQLSVPVCHLNEGRQEN